MCNVEINSLVGNFFILRVNSHNASCSATLYFSGETSIKVDVWKTERER